MRAKYRRRSRKERSRPSRSPQSRHQPINPAIDFLAFEVLGCAVGVLWVCCGCAVGVLGAIEVGMEHREDIQAIQSHTEPSRATQGHTEPFRAIYQAIMCDISPSTVFSRRRSFPLLCTSIIDHRRRPVAVLSSSPSRPSPVAHTHHTPPTPLSKKSKSQAITTDAKYRGICHITQRRARNCGSRRDKWWCSRTGTGYFDYILPDGYAAR